MKMAGLLMTLMKFLTRSTAAFFGTPVTVPSSNTPRNRSPPKRFRKEQTLSYTSCSIPFPQRLNSTATVSPTARIDSNVAEVICSSSDLSVFLLSYPDFSISFPLYHAAADGCSQTFEAEAGHAALRSSGVFLTFKRSMPVKKSFLGSENSEKAWELIR